ncbi:peptidoglycan DD-metalloendopeptidase family protein [bacterium]|nr:peptidoglycan DD-metalloendopeptidase family protein [bacterium]MBU1614879.1 peptidoglycan DD-metalloendopeptidase family protein [bacterium]
MRLNLLIFSFIFFLSCASSRSVQGEGVYHLVKKDQTLWRIAKTYDVALDTIITANKIKDVTNIKVGQRIFIPGATRILEVIPYQAKEALEKEVYHTIRPDQTLWRIAKTYDVPLDDIITANQIKDVTDIKIGRKIFIPEATKVLKVIPYRIEEEVLKKGVYHLVEPGQTLWRIANTYDVALEDILAFNKIADVTDIEVGRKIFVPRVDTILKVEVYRPADMVGEYPDFLWPVEGEIVSKFGPRGRSFHKGIDIGNSYGTPIYAAASGVVAVSRSMRGYGNVVILTHTHNFDTVYAHNSVNLVHEGQRVKQGEIIGKVGRTGNATTPHLHFEIREKGLAKNPLVYLPGR